MDKPPITKILLIGDCSLVTELRDRPFDIWVPQSAYRIISRQYGRTAVATLKALQAFLPHALPDAPLEPVFYGVIPHQTLDPGKDLTHGVIRYLKDDKVPVFLHDLVYQTTPCKKRQLQWIKRKPIAHSGYRLREITKQEMDERISKNASRQSWWHFEEPEKPDVILHAMQRIRRKGGVVSLHVSRNLSERLKEEREGFQNLIWEADVVFFDKAWKEYHKTEDRATRKLKDQLTNGQLGFWMWGAWGVSVVHRGPFSHPIEIPRVAFKVGPFDDTLLAAEAAFVGTMLTQLAQTNYMSRCPDHYWRNHGLYDMVRTAVSVAVIRGRGAKWPEVWDKLQQEWELCSLGLGGQMGQCEDRRETGTCLCRTVQGGLYWVEKEKEKEQERKRKEKEMIDLEFPVSSRRRQSLPKELTKWERKEFGKINEAFVSTRLPPLPLVSTQWFKREGESSSNSRYFDSKRQEKGKEVARTDTEDAERRDLQYQGLPKRVLPLLTGSPFQWARNEGQSSKGDSERKRKSTLERLSLPVKKPKW